jgi:hypothetical protein
MQRLYEFTAAYAAQKNIRFEVVTFCHGLNLVVPEGKNVQRILLTFAGAWSVDCNNVGALLAAPVFPTSRQLTRARQAAPLHRNEHIYGDFLPTVMAFNLHPTMTVLYFEKIILFLLSANLVP